VGNKKTLPTLQKIHNTRKFMVQLPLAQAGFGRIYNNFFLLRKTSNSTMKSTAHAFKSQATLALKNTSLQSALARTKSHFIDKRH
jgi:hypothetical protein